MFKLTSFLIDDLHYWSYYVNRLEESYFLLDFEQFLVFLPGQHDLERRERLSSVRTPERRLRRRRRQPHRRRVRVGVVGRLERLVVKR